VRKRFGRSGLRFTTLVAAALVAGGLIACGDSEDPQALSFEISEKGKAAAITAPESAEAGLAEITLSNKTDNEADLQLIRIEGDHSAEEVVEGLGEAVEGQPFPDWFFAAGGVGTTAAGKSATVTQVLQPGTYYAFNTEGQGPPAAKDAVSTEVTGDEADDELPDAAATVEAGEYVFEPEAPLPSGTNEIAFDNVGAQPHHLLASKLIGDSTAEDVEEFFKTEEGPAPLSENATRATAVIEGGEAQLVTLDLQPGRYALYCFITDRQGGPPHALKGMVDEVEVK